MKSYAEYFYIMEKGVAKVFKVSQNNDVLSKSPMTSSVGNFGQNSLNVHEVNLRLFINSWIKLFFCHKVST